MLLTLDELEMGRVLLWALSVLCMIQIGTSKSQRWATFWFLLGAVCATLLLYSSTSGEN